VSEHWNPDEPDEIVLQQLAEIERIRKRLAAAEAERDAARETNRRLNARCQAAESAIPSYRKMVALPPDGDGIRFVRGSFGRALLAYHCDKLEQRLADATALLREAVHMNDLAMQDFPVPLPIEDWVTRAKEVGGE
jgi:hypothetical protein